jgi:hypothetical protein
MPTRCISQVLGIAEPDSYSDAEYHEQPVDLRDVYLAMDSVRRVHNFHSGKAAQGQALVDNGERSTDDSLASDHRRQNS